MTNCSQMSFSAIILLKKQFLFVICILLLDIILQQDDNYIATDQSDHSIISLTIFICLNTFGMILTF